MPPCGGDGAAGETLLFDVVSGECSVAPNCNNYVCGGGGGSRLHGLVGGCRIFRHASTLHRGDNMRSGVVKGDIKVGATRTSLGADITVIGVDNRMMVMALGSLRLVLGHVDGWRIDFLEAYRNGTEIRICGSARQRIGCGGWSSSGSLNFSI